MMALTPKRLFLYLCISISLLRPYTFFSRSPLVNKTLFENRKVREPIRIRKTFDLAEVKLSRMEQEVLELGLNLDFGLPQKSSREEILADFELLHQTLIKYRPISKEEADTCRAPSCGHCRKDL